MEKSRINILPDFLVGEILSRLPTVDAVRTSILAKDWIDKWTFMYNVDIDAREFFDLHSGDKDETFVKFVEKIFELPEIRSFHLKISERRDFIQKHFITWIFALLQYKIESLQMSTIFKDIEDVFTEDVKPILPSSLLNCLSLKNLKLIIPCTFKIGVHNYFAYLLRLTLAYVTILNEDSNSDTMRLTFPVLQEIDLYLCVWAQVKVVEMYAPSLTIFKSSPPYGVHSQVDNYTVKIIGARLQEFHMFLGTPESIELVDTTVVYASLACPEPIPKDSEDDEDELEEFGLHARKLLAQLSCVQNMKLGRFLEVIAYTKQGGLPLPRFMKLEKLDLYYSIDGDGLLELLHAIPSLRSLNVIMTQDRNDYNYDVVESVPSCLLSNLEKLSLDYSGCEEEPYYNVAKFLLENGVQLKSVDVLGSVNFPMNVIVQKLRALGFGSLKAFPFPDSPIDQFFFQLLLAMR